MGDREKGNIAKIQDNFMKFGDDNREKDSDDDEEE